MTRDEAVKELNALADYCEDENYHSEAGAIWDHAIPAVQKATGPTTVIVTGVDGVTVLEIEGG